MYRTCVTTVNPGNYWLKASATIILYAGWSIFITLCALLAIGYLAFFGSISTLIATNPFLAAALLLVGGTAAGTGAVLVWRNREVIKAAKKAAENFKPRFEKTISDYPKLEDRLRPINELHLQCVIAIIESVLNVNIGEKYKQIE